MLRDFDSGSGAPSPSAHQKRHLFLMLPSVCENIEQTSSGMLQMNTDDVY